MTIFSPRAKLETWRLSSRMSGFLSTNCSVITFLRLRILGRFGLCFRDTNGHFVAGLTQWHQSSYSIVEGEALALLHAMKEAIHRGFERVQFES
ncbi:hypothetical protein L195_g060833, partial [Trifolium pratense]